jgi:hypothetical protein
MSSAWELDSDEIVRDQAAWAMGWYQTSTPIRVESLARAAARDGSEQVRVTAANSLASLAKQVPLARSALLALTDPEFGDEHVRRVALRVVDALPPSEFGLEETSLP